MRAEAAFHADGATIWCAPFITDEHAAACQLRDGEQVDPLTLTSSAESSVHRIALFFLYMCA